MLALAGGPRPGAVSLATFGADEFTTALPIEVALAPETLLVYEMNGQVLPREHGYPVRMLVPGRYGMKNAKWVVALRVMNREFVDWYGQRNWSRTAIVKTMSRIDVPAPGATLAPGEHRIAGIAYAGDRGVAYVEFSADGGRTWEVAELLEQPRRPGRLGALAGDVRGGAGAGGDHPGGAGDGRHRADPAGAVQPAPAGRRRRLVRRRRARRAVVSDRRRRATADGAPHGRRGADQRPGDR